MSTVPVDQRVMDDLRELVEAWGEDPQRFTPWEQQFCRDLNEKIHRWGSSILVSPNQYEQVERMLEEKVRV